MTVRMVWVKVRERDTDANARVKVGGGGGGGGVVKGGACVCVWVRGWGCELDVGVSARRCIHATTEA